MSSNQEEKPETSVVGVVPEAVYDIVARVLPGAGLLFGFVFVISTCRPGEISHSLEFLIEHYVPTVACSYVLGLLMPPLIQALFISAVAEKTASWTWFGEHSIDNEEDQTSKLTSAAFPRMSWSRRLAFVRKDSGMERRLLKLLSEADLCAGLFNAWVIVVIVGFVSRQRWLPTAVSGRDYWFVAGLAALYLYVQSVARLRRYRRALFSA
jgi:hypothetical protein